MTARNTSGTALTDLQQAILNILWARGPATADQIRGLLHTRHPLKDSSVRTLLRRLESRGFVKHHVDGKVFVYSAEAPALRVAAHTVKQIIERFCAGSVEQFLLGMVDEKVLSRREIERLAQKLKQPETARGKDQK